jgi:hypothetical protein
VQPIESLEFFNHFSKYSNSKIIFTLYGRAPLPPFKRARRQVIVKTVREEDPERIYSSQKYKVEGLVS